MLSFYLLPFLVIHKKTDVLYTCNYVYIHDSYEFHLFLICTTILSKWFQSIVICKEGHIDNSLLINYYCGVWCVYGVRSQLLRVGSFLPPWVLGMECKLSGLCSK